MRERRRGRDRLRVLRRGVGLGLALVTVWGVGLTADLSGVGEAVRAWSADSQAVVGLLAEQLGQVPEETALAGMDGLGRLMVEQSALLSAGLEAVDATANTLGGSVESAGQVIGMMTKISGLSVQQAESINQIRRSVEAISEIVQGNSATSEESAAASEELSGQAELLKEQAAKFRLHTEEL